MNKSTFMALVPGDKITARGGTKIWTVETVNAPKYGASADFQVIIKGPEFGLLKILNDSAAFSWERAPKPFYKVGETYQWTTTSGDGKMYKVMSLHTTSDGKRTDALLEFDNWDGKRAHLLFDEGDFEAMTKVTTAW